MTANPAIMTKEEALAAYSGSVSALATALDISSSAIYQWVDEQPIPEDKALKLRFVLKPEFFGEAPKRAPKRKAA